MSLIGERDCVGCQMSPTHTLLPCLHTICHDHIRLALLIATDEHICIQCHQTVLGVAEARPSHLAQQHHAPLRTSYPSDFIHPDFVPQTPGPQAAFPRQSNTQTTRPRAISGQGMLQNTPLEDPFVCGPLTSPQHPANLADLIKSGAFEDGPTSPLEPSRHARSQTVSSTGGFTADSHHTSVAVPVVRHWGAHMVDLVAVPPFLQAAQHGQLPEAEEAITYQPFIEPASHVKPSTGGVVVIPYACTKAEIIAAIGRNSRIVSQPPGSPYYGIHIIMERSTGKTMDCYVELENTNEARGIVNAYRSRCERGRAPRVGDRHVEVDLSSQAELMTQLFPKARCVQWSEATPILFNSNEAYNSGFMGFVTVEECAMVVKHAETPQRSPFMARSLNRVYESMISLLFKFPWFKTDLVTLGERQLLFKTTVSLLRALVRAVATNSNPVQLTQMLLQELVCAALTAPFGHDQKCEIVQLLVVNGFAELASSVGYASLIGNNGSWPFETLDIKVGVSDEVVELYAALFRHASGSFDTTISPGDSLHPFGKVKVEYLAEDFRKLTIDSAAQSEYLCIVQTLQSILPSAHRDAMAGANRSRSSGSPVSSKAWNQSSPSPDAVLHQRMSSLSLVEMKPTSPTFDRAPGAHRSSTALVKIGSSSRMERRAVSPPSPQEHNSMSPPGDEQQRRDSTFGGVPLQARFPKPKALNTATAGPRDDGAAALASPEQHLYSPRFNPTAKVFTNASRSTATSPTPHKSPAGHHSFDGLGANLSNAGRMHKPAKSFTEIALDRGIRVSTPAPTPAKDSK